MKTHKTVIVNTSPLYYLHKLRCLDCLEKLYSEIVVPEAVALELEEGERAGVDTPKIIDHQWVNVRRVAIPAFIKIIPDLGQGEAEVLALGCEVEAPLLIIDDLLARRIARLQALKFTGTAGVLLKAKQAGYIVEIKPFIEKLKDEGFYLTDKLITDILKLSGE